MGLGGMGFWAAVRGNAWGDGLRGGGVDKAVGGAGQEVGRQGGPCLGYMGSRAGCGRSCRLDLWGAWGVERLRRFR